MYWNHHIYWSGAQTNLGLLAIIDQFQQCSKIHAESYPQCSSVIFIQDRSINTHENTNTNRHENINTSTA